MPSKCVVWLLFGPLLAVALMRGLGWESLTELSSGIFSGLDAGTMGQPLFLQQQYDRQRRATAPEERNEETNVALWQGLVLTYIPNAPAPTSRVHCIGENFNPLTAWQYKSCAFVNLCLDTTQRENGNDGFVVFRSDVEEELYDLYTNSQSSGHWQSTVTLSTILSDTHNSVSLQSILRTDKNDTSTAISRNAKWFPKILSSQEARETYDNNGYYLLPDHVVWIPWLPPPAVLNEHNKASRHWLWTSWYPIYVLASLFSFAPNDRVPRQLLPLVPPSFGANAAQSALIEKLAEHLGHPLTMHDDPTPNIRDQPRLICVRHAVAGVGHLAPKLGETDSIGHGPTLSAFGQYVRHQVLGIDKESTVTTSIANGIVLMATPNLPEHIVQMVRAVFPTFEKLDETMNLGQQAKTLSQARVVIMTPSLECAAPLLVPNHTRILVLHHPVTSRYMTDCVYVLNNAAHLHVEWIDAQHTTEQALIEAANVAET